MKCNNCGTHMKLAIQADLGVGANRIIGLSSYDSVAKGLKSIGDVVYCPKCGNLQVDLERRYKMNLSSMMITAVEQMKAHGELIRYPGGFWSWRDVEIKNEIPAWYCDVKTLRALGKRGIVNLDETKKICKLNRYFED